MLSAYQTPVPDTIHARDDALRRERRGEKETPAAAAATTRKCMRYVPTVMIELFVLNSSELAGANGSATQRFPSTMNAYS